MKEKKSMTKSEPINLKMRRMILSLIFKISNSEIVRMNLRTSFRSVSQRYSEHYSRPTKSSVESYSNPYLLTYSLII